MKHITLAIPAHILTKPHPAPLPDPGQPPRRGSTLVHDFFVAFDPHWYDIGTDVRLEYQTRDAPFEIPHRFLRVLVHAAFGEDVDPAVSARGVRGGRREGVGAVGRVGEVRIWGREGV